MESQFFWGIIAGAVIVLVGFLVPAILQVTRTAKAAEQLLKTTEESLNPLILKLNETVERANRVVEEVELSIGNVQNLTKAIGETGAIVSDINNSVRSIQKFFWVTACGFGAGIKTAFSVLTKGAVEKITSQR